MQATLEKVYKICHQPTQAQRSLYADNTLNWFHLFLELFIEGEDSCTNVSELTLASTLSPQFPPLHSSLIDSDDILYFVRMDGPSLLSTNAAKTLVQETHQADPIFVRRRLATSKTLPRLDSLVNWEESVYLNLIVQMKFILRVATCTRDPMTGSLLVTRQLSRRVFASPSYEELCPQREGAKHGLFGRVLPTGQTDATATTSYCTYPTLYFSVHDYEQCFGNFAVERDELFCVELGVRVVSNKQTDPEASEVSRCEDDLEARMKPYQSINSEASGCLLLFQGAVKHAALATIVLEKTLHSSTTSTCNVLMRGPQGKGHAEVALSNITVPKKSDGSSRGLVWSIFGSRFKHDDGNNDEKRFKHYPEKILCRLMFVNLHWRLILVDLLGWLEKQRESSD